MGEGGLLHCDSYCNTMLLQIPRRLFVIDSMDSYQWTPSNLAERKVAPHIRDLKYTLLSIYSTHEAAIIRYVSISITNNCCD